MNDIRNRIFGKSSEKKRLTADDIGTIHDTLMVEYGWIPLEDFKKLPISTLWVLWGKIMERMEERKKMADKQKGGKRKLR